MKYYPFGSLVPNRHGSSTAYRYGYQGSEKDDEIKGEGNSYTTHYRLLDPRVGRWLTRDPKFTAFESPYASMGNNPILFNDKPGDTIRMAKIADFQGKTPKYHHSKAGKSFNLLQSGQDAKDKNVWTITPYYDNKDNVVGYAAGRLGKGSDYAIEYYLDKGDFASFSKSLDNYQLASDLFLMNGPPSESQLSFMSGLNNGSVSETLNGLGKMWKEAIKDPQWWAYTLSASMGSVVQAGQARQTFSKNMKYAPRVRQRAIEGGAAHRFPYSFDKTIIEQGEMIKVSDTYIKFRMEGTMINEVNQGSLSTPLKTKSGYYEIGFENGQVTHRTFTTATGN
ncbi:hypothetical protein B0A78_13240 [Flavobacterium columnare NBRC 100251 = ATCC 23463]|uniref:RHS repeat-associated core domain-containing protein n=2 Tax=Flavobacterium columnare TaxID=996 RepID=UPI000BE97EAF|nr:hypothetical protein B0A78_13240 [Flavobacterium columnare NBRC 100251 = ATCC 23463]